MQMELCEKAYEILEEYIHRASEPDKMSGHHTFNDVGFYIDSNDIDTKARKLVGIEETYFTIKFSGIDLNFKNGYLSEINYIDNTLDILQDFYAFLDDVSKMVRGETVITSPNKYALKNHIIERTVEKVVENPELKVKAEILDSILHRELTVGRG